MNYCARSKLCTLSITASLALLPACSDDTNGADASGTAETGTGETDGNEANESNGDGDGDGDSGDGDGDPGDGDGDPGDGDGDPGDGDGDGDPGDGDPGDGDGDGDACGLPGAILCTTLEDGAAITNPAAGDGTGATWQTNPVDDFVAAQVGNGINIDGNDEHVRFRQIGAMNAPPNIDTSVGTIEFWYLPLYSANDGLNHHLFASSEDFSNGGMRVRKAAANNNNNFQVITVDQSGNFVGEVGVAPQDTPFAPGNWVKIRITWDFTVGNNVQSVHVYFDDVEPPYVGVPMGPASLPPAVPTEHVWIGAWMANDTETASGLIDEFAIYDQALAP